MDMSQEIEKLNQRLNTMEPRLKKLDEIHYALLGNAIAQDGGLVQRIKDLEENQQDMEEELDEIAKKLNSFSVTQKILWGAIGGVGMAIVTLILQQAFK